MQQCNEPIHVRLSKNLKTNSESFRIWSTKFFIFHIKVGVAHVVHYFPLHCYNHLSAKNQCTRPCELPDWKGVCPICMWLENWESMGEVFAQENTIDKLLKDTFQHNIWLISMLVLSLNQSIQYIIVLHVLFWCLWWPLNKE